MAKTTLEKKRQKATSKNVPKVTSKKRNNTAQRIIEATRKSNGLITDIAAKAHLNRYTVSKYVKDFPSVAEAVEDAQETLCDTVESKLYEKIQAGDTTAIIFFLKTRCKHRGYVERQEHAGLGGKPIEVQFYLPENNRDNKTSTKAK